MPAITSAVLRPPLDRFPPGTVVGAYRGNAWSGADKTVAPTGAADVSATVQADGSLTFAGLTDQTSYHAWAAGAGAAVRFTTRHDRADDISTALVGSGTDVRVNGAHVAVLNATTPVVPGDIGAATAAALTSEISRAQSAEALLKPPAYYLNGGVNLRESVPRPASVSDTPAALTSGVMTLVAIVLYAGDVITNLTFRSHTTAAVAPTNWWFALYDPAFNLLSQTADQGAAAWTANTPRTRALAAPQTIATTGVYYAACMVAATTVPSLTCLNITSGMNGAGAVVAGQKLIAGTSGAALTTTAPAVAAAPASLGPIPYAVAS